VSEAGSAKRSERKALLATRADLDRTRVTLAAHEIRALVAPVADIDRTASARPLATMLVRLAGPFVGRIRLARWLRIASLALVALRIVRGWK
jgi:hypothetical protein